MHLDPWTLALQALNFLVLVWLLNRFLYRPVVAMLAARQKAADALVGEAKASKEAAEALQRDLAARRAAIEDDRRKVLADAHAQASAERKAILDKATLEARAAADQARAAVEQDRAAAAAGLGRDAARLATAMVRRLLGEAPAAAVQAGMLDQVVADVRALPEESRRGVAGRAASDGAACVVTTAEALAPAAAKRLEAKLSEALGATLACEFQVDPALIAGVEVRFPFTKVRRAWADDLARIDQEMTHVEPAAPVA